MTADRTDDILGLLDEVHGDGQSRRETTVNDAVGHIERSAYRGYNAMRDLAQRGTARPAAAVARGPMPSPFEDPTDDPPTHQLTATIATPVAAPAVREPEALEPEPSEAETRISAPPPKPEKPRIPDPVEVLSGDGAAFRERGHTQTHIIRRPKSWFRRR